MRCSSSVAQRDIPVPCTLEAVTLQPQPELTTAESLRWTQLCKCVSVWTQGPLTRLRGYAKRRVATPWCQSFSHSIFAFSVVISIFRLSSNLGTGLFFKLDIPLNIIGRFRVSFNLDVGFFFQSGSPIKCYQQV